MTDLSDERRKAMVDERVCRIVAALPPRDEGLDEVLLIHEYLADEWACLEVAARVVAPAFGLDAMDDDLVVKLQRAAHEALKSECRRLAGERGR